jgi:hypothetical protein
MAMSGASLPARGPPGSPRPPIEPRGGGRSVTDPNLNAWYDSAGAENGDKCAWNFGTLDEDGGMANQQWNGHFYVLQQEWDNLVSGCVQQGP